MRYNRDMKVKEFSDNFRALVGDSTVSTPDRFIISGLNWCFNELPLTPKLNKVFSKHIKANLDAEGHYRWLLNDDFRRISEVPMLNFYTTGKGGEPCKLKVCYKPVVDFYTHNGIVELKESGVPCEYTLEEEGDKLYLVFDRPLDVPMMVDYIVYGFPKPVHSMEDEFTFEMTAPLEHLMIMALRTVWYQELDDFAFAGSIYDYLDNKYYPQVVQLLHKRWETGRPIILGEA